MSFAKLNRTIWSSHYTKLIQSFKLDLFSKQSKEFVLKNCYTIINLNGINFEEFTNKHQFVKPNDMRAKHLMDHCAKSLIDQFKPHILLSYGFSDQFTFVINKQSNFCDYNLASILSVIVSNFTSNYVFNWSNFFDCKLQYAPEFKASYLLLPVNEYLIKYIQAKHHECYILNLNQTLCSALIGQYKYYEKQNDGTYELKSLKDDDQKFKKFTNETALNLIKNEIDTISKINEYLFKEYGINYNNELELFRKGTFMYLDNEHQKINSYNVKLNETFLSSILSNENSKLNINQKDSSIDSQIVSSDHIKIDNQIDSPINDEIDSPINNQIVSPDDAKIDSPIDNQIDSQNKHFVNVNQSILDKDQIVNKSIN